MHIDISHAGYSIKTNYEAVDFEMEISWGPPFNANELPINIIFDYEKIYKSLFVDEFCIANIPDNEIVVPTNRKDFFQSEIWELLGFKHPKDFEIISISISISYDFYETYGQTFEASIDFKEEKIVVDDDYVFSNNLDALIFDYGFYDDECYQMDGDEVLRDLTSIYSDYKHNIVQLIIELSDYFSRISDNEDEFVPYDYSEICDFFIVQIQEDLNLENVKKKESIEKYVED